MLRTSSGIFVPPRVARDQIEQTEEFKQLAMQVARRYEGIMRYWSDRLRVDLNDDKLELVFWPPDADDDAGLTPGRYHVVRWNDPPTPPTFKTIEKDGRFVEPGEWLIAEMREADLQNAQLVRAAADKKRAAELSAEREKEHDIEVRREHIKDLWNAAYRTSISMNRDTPWTQTASGKRGRKKG